MHKPLNFLQKNLVYVIPVAMVLGFIGGGYLFNAKPLKQLIIPITFVMIYPMMTTLNTKAVFSGGDLRLQVVTQFINFVIVPIVVYSIGKIFLTGGGEKLDLWAVGLFLIGVLPASGMTVSWTGFAKGNKEAATKMLVFGLIIGALVAPVYTKAFMGATVDVDMAYMFRQICIFVFLPLFAGLFTQNYLVKKHGRKTWMEIYKPKFPPFSALGVTMIAFTAMSLKAKNIMANPGDIITILIPLIVFYLMSYVLLTLVGKLFFKRGDAIAMVFGVVMRDLSIALAIALTAFKEQGMTIALLIAIAYVIQIQSAAWYIRLVPKIFGPAEAEYEAAQVMHRGLFSLYTSDTLKNGVRLLAEEDIHSVAVLNEDEQVQGVLTLQQAIDYIADDVSLEISLADLQLEKAVLVDMHQPVSKIAKTMKRKHEYKVLITNDKGKIQGVVTAHDIMGNFIAA